jgi:diguanylate cyclase (GGDEF)-like protein/PAS domain S-box-containing protein
VPRKSPAKDRPRQGNLKEVRARLADADEALRAIREGDLDALVVSNSEGKSLLALEGASQPYRLLIENMNEGALTLTPAGLVLYANRRFAEMLGTPLEKVMGSDIHSWFDAESGRAVATLLQRPESGKRSEELALTAADGTRVPVYLSVNPLHLEAMPDSICMVVTDLTERKRNEAVLAAEILAHTILDQAADAIVICDPTGRIIRASKQAQAFCDHDPHGELFDRAFPLRQLDGTSAASVAPGDSSRSRSVEARLERNGLWLDFLVSIGYLTGTGGELLGSVATLTDITERKKAADKVMHLNRVYAMLSGINELIVRVSGRDELFREACRIAVDKGGFRMTWIGIADWRTKKIVPVASVGMHDAILAFLKDNFSLSEDSPLSKTMSAQAVREKRAVVSNDSQNDLRILLRSAHVEYGVRSMAILPLIVADEAVGVFALYSGEADFFRGDELKLLTDLAGDIAFAIDHIEKQARLDYLAYYDVLTGLANRSLFLERLAQHLRSAVTGGHRLAVFLIDLERFKSINDSLGRSAGDELLKQVAGWLTRNLGDVNHFARIDADHFAIVLPEVSADGNVTRLVEKVMAAFLQHPFHLNGGDFRIATKVGVAFFPQDGVDADTLYKNAEAALKKAKISGDRYLLYAHRMTETVAGNLNLENQLRMALHNEEFLLHYQPKVNLASGKLTGAEALIRWNDPRTGLVPPARFIPILEETGLIHEVGRWALRQAIADYLRWCNIGLKAVRIAVNVSPLQLRNQGFVAEIKSAIGIDPHAAAGLELEITESVIMEDVRLSIDTLRAIRAMGPTIAIDDFGTGYSSLSHLAKLPVDTLKVDRSFITGMTLAPEGFALVSTIIKLGHSLNLKVVAEGVETEEQASLLRTLACDEMQGYLFGKPVSVEIFEEKYLECRPALAG